MTQAFRQFQGTRNYITDPALEAAVNAAIALERPLLVKGEPPSFGRGLSTFGID